MSKPRFSNWSRRLILIFTLAAVFISAGPVKQAFSFIPRIFNPLTDVCWWCVFPIKLGGIGIPPAGLDTTSLPVIPYGFPPPICWCPKPTPVLHVEAQIQ